MTAARQEAAIPHPAGWPSSYARGMPITSETRVNDRRPGRPTRDGSTR